MRLWKSKLAAIGFLLFVGLWFVGVLRGVEVPYPQPTSWEFASGSADRYANRQVANNIKQLGMPDAPLPTMLDEAADKVTIFEKRAQLSSRSSDFDSDQSQIRQQLAEHKAVVFFENSEGTAPGRKLYLEINVPPEQFDSLVARLKSIGHLQGTSVQQRDRTGEFRKLHAQRQTLKQHHDALLKLRGIAQLSLDDSLKLEQKIIDLEKELQTVGVQMGDLAGKESYYHVNLTMVEYLAGGSLDPTFTWPQRILHGFAWAFVWWLVAAAAAAVVVGIGLSVWVLRR